jgi:regulatory protein
MPAASSQTRSLKARALQWLAQREQSRVELRRKLLRRARAEPLTESLAEGRTESITERVEAVLDWLESHGYLSAERFVESLRPAMDQLMGSFEPGS